MRPLRAPDRALPTSGMTSTEVVPATADAVVQPYADEQGWDDTTQLGLLLAFVDDLITEDPGIAGRLRAHLAEVAAVEDGAAEDGPAETVGAVAAG
jgi:hypothetical protein